MKNKIKIIGVVVGAGFLILVGFGLGKWSAALKNAKIEQLGNLTASLQEQIETFQKQAAPEGNKEKESASTKASTSASATADKEENECFSEKLSPTGPTRLAKVSYVVDGDTIEVDGGEKIRYLGMNTPESGRPYFTEATNENKKIVEGKEVKLEFDIQTKDRYGRTLAYVFVGEVMVNLELICRGYANTYTFPPDVKYKDNFLEAERDARENQRGLWMPPNDTTQAKIKVVNINANAPGNDNNNKNGEWVEIKNQGENSVNMTNWTLKDEANHIYTFSDFILAPDKNVFIYSGCGADTQEKLYWQCPEGKYAIWNNTGDTAFLRDASGNLVDSYKY